MARTWKFCDELVLASASPRRKELLAPRCERLIVMPADVDESKVAATSPRALVKELSRRKASAVAVLDGYRGKTVVGADTVVYLDKLYGKPRDIDDAVRMLSELSGKQHYVYTGVTVIGKSGKTVTFSVRSAVQMKRLSREQIEDYVRDFCPLDKAGAYAVQEGVVVESVKGSYSNVVGLPLEKLGAVLKSEEV